jgi:hypothetical protein
MGEVHAKSHQIFLNTEVKLRDVSCHFCVFPAQMLLAVFFVFQQLLLIVSVCVFFSIPSMYLTYLLYFLLFYEVIYLVSYCLGVKTLY